MYQALTGFGVAVAAAAHDASAPATTRAQERSLMDISRRAPRPPHVRAGRARARPTRSPRGRARAARRGARARSRPRARAPRSVRAGPTLLAPPPCLEGRRQLVTCLCQLARALLEACDSPVAPSRASSRSRTRSEERRVGKEC